MSKLQKMLTYWMMVQFEAFVSMVKGFSPISLVMNTNIFVVFALTISCGITYLYAEIREFYTPIKAYKVKMGQLKTKLKKERSSHLMTSYEFQEFRNHVATLLPGAIKTKGEGEASYPLRTLASVVQKSTSEPMVLSRSKILFEEGKSNFRQKNYDQAVVQFRQLIEQHAYSGYIPEALLLLVESYFVLGHEDKVIQYANKMIDLYPENELTGYAMIRLGKIYEQKDRHSEAMDIYKTVLLTFPNRHIASVAQASLRAVEL